MEQPMMRFFGFPWMPIDVSEHGAALDHLNWLLHLLALLLFVGWSIYFIFVLFRFHRSRNPKASYEGTKTKLSSLTEVGVIVAEVILLAGFSIPLWAQWTDDFPEEADSVVVRMVAEQFTWSYHYPGTDGVFGGTKPELIDLETNILGLDPDDPNGKDDVIAKRLYLPVDNDVIVHLSSKDVIHSLGIPAMRVKQDAIPGVTIPVTFKAVKEGKYLIACSQLCGNGHSTMRGFIEVQSENSFASWMAKEVAKSLTAGDADDSW
ncbi:MAG: Alternative cytochrome c oxidase subunit 2 [Candidatus Moanabacter tarae]|uniref:cytochrome-c oxidase n=1 Tax=Candidatus Moanibacter tarae TaxID=2200854 RepID=A0A2Z4ADZ2_9BACT|nr:MAG: Alternative cytochrome c oxidase subunit 2 [Candidatus Moanabacter tarae]